MARGPGNWKGVELPATGKKLSKVKGSLWGFNMGFQRQEKVPETVPCVQRLRETFETFNCEVEHSGHVKKSGKWTD